MWKKFFIWLGKQIAAAAASELAKKVAEKKDGD